MRTRTLAIAAALALLSTAPAAADRAVLTAYGEGTTTCIVTASATDEWGEHNFARGSTQCSVPVEQTAQVWGHVPGQWPSGLCEGLRDTCDVSTSWTDHDEQNAGVDGTPEATYEVSLRAPLGQGWGVAPADKCSGVGTDNLRCTFTSRAILLWVGT